MNRFTVFADIASRAMHATAGSPRTVAGAVVVDTEKVEGLCRELVGLGKWSGCRLDDAEFAVDLIASQAVAVSVVSFNRDTEAWRQFLVDAEIFHKAIILNSRKVAGWGKPANLLKFLLLSSACASAVGHALGIDHRPRIVNSNNMQMINCITVCDSEVEGPENIEVFKSFWDRQHIPKSRLASVGIEMLSEDVRITSEQLEPCLLLADYVAGLGLSAATENPGRIPLPLSQVNSSKLLSKIRDRDKLVVLEEDFQYSYNEIFGDTMEQARSIANC